MTFVLVLYAEDAEVRLVDVDVDRRDVLLGLLDTDAFSTYNFPELGSQLLLDDHGLRKKKPVNLAATMLIYGSGRRPLYPFLGDVILLGLTVDGETSDPPEDLLYLFDPATTATAEDVAQQQEVAP
jgi:hypothetical protein